VLIATIARVGKKPTQRYKEGVCVYITVMAHKTKTIRNQFKRQARYMPQRVPRKYSPQVKGCHKNEVLTSGLSWRVNMPPARAIEINTRNRFIKVNPNWILLVRED
jgi:hypothetical protein